MQQGRGGMGSHKHGISGRAGKSPAFRHWIKREAEKLIRKGRHAIERPYSSVYEALKNRK